MTRVSDMVLTLESKKLGRLTDLRHDAAMNGARRWWPDSMRTRAIRSALEKLIAEHVEWVKAAAADFNREDARKTILVRFGAALQLGHTLAGVRNVKPANLEVASIASLAETELEYLEAFARGDEAMNSSQRSALYGLGVQAAMYRGWLASFPTNAEFYWRLGIAEHCDGGNANATGGCLGLETGNPYTKPGFGANQLPTLPGNGDTRCLGNCRCFIEARVPGGVRNSLAPRVAIEVLAIAGREQSPTSPAGIAWTQQYQDLAERVAFFTRMRYLDKPERAYWDHLLDETKAEIEKISRRLNHEVRYTVTDAELLAPVNAALANGMRFVPPSELGSDLLDWIVWLLAADYATQGKVIEVFKSSQTGGPAVKLEGHPSPFRLDGSGRFILFRSQTKEST